MTVTPVAPMLGRKIIGPYLGRRHPAVDIVERTERLWQDDPRTAADRANLIVSRLIQTGHLTGRVHVDVALAVEDEPVIAGEAAHGG